MENPVEEKHVEDPNVREARQHARAAREEVRRTIESFFPAGVVEHRRAAQREFLLAMRSMLNAAIDRIDRIERDKPAQEA